MDDLNSKTMESMPVHRAAKEGNLPVLKQLLSSHADEINQIDDDLCTPIHNALDNGFEDIALEFLKHDKCDVHVKRQYKEKNKKENQSAYLHLACAKGFGRIVEFLLSLTDCNVNVRDAFGRVPLNIVAKCGYVDITRMLLAREDCDVNAVNNEKRPSLFYACEEGHVKIVELLLNYKDCDIHLIEYAGSMPFHRCFRKENSSKTIKELIKLFIVKDDISKCLTTVNTNRQSVMVRLLEYKGEMNNYYYDDDYMECIRLLVQHKESISAVEYMLAIAIQYTTEEVCRLLLENCPTLPDGRPLVDVGYPPRQGETEGEAPIFCALIKQSPDMVRLLLGKAAGLNVPWQANLDVKWLGMDPLSFAISTNCSAEIIDLLARNVGESRKNELLQELAYYGESTHSHAKRLKLEHWLNQDQKPQILNKREKNEFIYKQISKTDVPPKGLSLTLHSDTIKRIVACANWCNTDSELPKMKSDMIQFLNRISTVLASKEVTKHFAFVPHIAGSSAEGTKTFNPDELDTVCVFTNDSGIQASGDIVRLVDKNSPWAAYVDDRDIVVPRVVAEGFYQALGAAIKTEYEQKGSTGGFKLHPNTLDIRNKISLLQLLYESDRIKGLIVHVDVVPAFKLPGFKPDRPLLLGAKCDEYHLIAKEKRHEYKPKKVQFRISYAGAEVASIQALPAHLRNGYAIAKALRIGAVSSPKNIDSLRLRQTIKADEYVTSYMLKTSLLKEAKERDVSKGNAYDWTGFIYTRLQKEVKTRLVEAYFKKEDWILDCDEEHEPWFQHKCCKTREVILALCESVLCWLKANKRDLEQISYGKHQVYRRSEQERINGDVYWVKQIRPKPRMFQL